MNTGPDFCSATAGVFWTADGSLMDQRFLPPAQIRPSGLQLRFIFDFQPQNAPNRLDIYIRLLEYCNMNVATEL